MMYLIVLNIPVSNMVKDGSITKVLVIFLGFILISSSATAFNVPVLAASPGTFIDTFVSAGSGLTVPDGLVIGPDGNFYVSSVGSSEVLRFDGSTGTFIDAFVSAGGGGLSTPRNLIFGPDGNLYVCSEDTDEVLRFDGSTGTFIDAFVSTGSGGLDNPKGLEFGPDGNLYVSSNQNHQVKRYDGTTGAFIDTFVSAGLNWPHSLEFGPDGNLYVSSWGTNEVLRYDGSTGTFIDAFVSAGSGGLTEPDGLEFGPDGNLYVVSILNDKVKRYDGTTGAFIDTFVSGGSGGLNAPDDLVFDSDDYLYVTSEFTNEILRYEGPFGVSISCNGKTVEEWEALGYTKFIGTTGDDVIVGTTGNDIIVSLDGDDDIQAKNGDDIICAGDGDNHVHGDDGNDVIITGIGNDDIDGNPGNDVISSGLGDDYVYAGYGDDTVDAGDGDNYVEGNPGADVITTGSGNDEIYGGDGMDTIDAGDGDNYIEGNELDDVISSGSGDDKIYGGAGDDTINAGDGDNVIEGLQGKDNIISGSGDDEIYGGNGEDVIAAGDGNNYVDGENGNDEISAGSGDDQLYGSGGDDCINSVGGSDTIDGGSGTNRINLGACDGSPTVTITSPSDGDSFIDGDLVTLSGSATDPEEGGISNNIEWVSDIYGSFGTGEILSSSTVPVGTHVITASVTDSDGNTSSQSITIVVNSIPTDPVKPILECVEDLGGGNYRAHFGYLNQNSIPVSIPIGSSNKFTPSPQDQGQPTSFNVGRTNYYPDAKFSIDFDGSNLVWTLKGPDGSTRTSTASSGGPSCPIVTAPTISILNPYDGFVSMDGNSITFTAKANDLEDGVISSSIKWTSDIDGMIGSGETLSILTLSVGTHTITASVTDSDHISNSVSIIVTVGSGVFDKLTLICHFPPGNERNYHEIEISPSALASHKRHGDYVGKCGGDSDIDKRLKLIKIKKQREEIRDKNELKEKREAIKEIKNGLKDFKNLDTKDKEKLKELIEDAKEVIKKLNENPEYVKEYKKILKDELKETKTKIDQDMTSEERVSKHKVDSKIHALSKSNDPKLDAKKLGLDYKNGKTTIAIDLNNANKKVLRDIASISTIDAKNNDHVQVKIKLQDLPKLRAIDGIENIRSPFSAIQYEEDLSEGVYFMNADLAQYGGITGKGVRVAVLDKSFTNNPKISENIVEVKSFRAGVDVFPIQWTGDEALHGTAVAEIITDVAPDAELYLYSMETDIEFANAVDWAISKKLDIIVMSAGWPNFPTDGTSHITKKIEEAVGNGIVFVVPAGNFANKHWEGKFVDSNFNNWHDYSNTDEGLSISVTEERIEAETPIITHLMWDVENTDVADFELVLVDPLGQIVAYSANEQLSKSDTPFEYIYHIPEIEGIYSIGVLYAGDMSKVSQRPSATLELFSINDELEHPVTKSSVSVPADADGAIVVGAINHLDGELEPFSSQGPTNNGKLAPHVVGPDGVTTLALDGKPFFGTSATTPYVAGLAALILETNPDITPQELLTKIQHNTDSSLVSLQDEFDYSSGYGSANAFFLIEDKEVLG